MLLALKQKLTELLQNSEQAKNPVGLEGRGEVKGLVMSDGRDRN